MYNKLHYIYREKCFWCKHLTYKINNRLSKKSSRIYFSPNKQKKLSSLNKTKKVVKQKGFRLAKRIRHLQENLNDLKNEMATISDSTLQQIIKDSNIPSCQTEIIIEIFKAAKLKNSKNRRYSENWMLLCLLFQIR